MNPASDLLSPALETTLRRFAGEVRRTAQGFGLAGDDVDELEQDIRIRLWKSLASGEKIGAAPASYIRQVARTAAIDLFRRRRARREDPLVLEADHVPVTLPTAERTLAHGELTAALGTALSSMVDSRQGVVRMFLSGYPREEIAQLLGWSEAKTRNLLYRGLDDLRERLSAMGIGPEAIG